MVRVLLLLCALSAACTPRAESDEPVVEPTSVVIDGRTVIDNVRESVELADGRLVVARTTDIGESDLWLVGRKGPPRAIAAAHGADEMPFVLDDGRIVFVSTRTGVASLWIVDVDGKNLRQLTNANLRARDPRFVPPPVRYIEQKGARLVYDDGDTIRSIELGGAQ